MAVKKLLQVFRQRLTNLSGNNRSLMLSRLYIGQHIDLQQYDFVLGKPAFDIIRQLLANKPWIPLCQAVDARDAANNRVSYLTKQLHRATQSVLEEQGAENLCVGYPFVQGKLNNDAIIRCPLLFFPVRLTMRNDKWGLIPREDVPVSFNKTFLLAYAHHNEQPLKQPLNEWMLENPFEDAAAFLTMLYRLLESASLELHFNTEQFGEQLQPFALYTRKELEAATATGKLKLVTEAVLGQFPQADSYLAPDYDLLLSDEQIADLEVFFNKVTARQAPREEEIVTPYEIDATQEQALRLIKSGRSLVVQGPPGTGKSQLIVNLIADAVASGKRALVVCQKKAALDVVYGRLQEKELHHLAALVHDFQQDRARIYANIARQIQQVQEKHERRVDVETLQQERQFLQLARQIAQQERELEDFRKALFDESVSGISAKTLYLTSSPRNKHIRLEDNLREYFHAEKATQFAQILRQYVAYAQQTDAPSSLWHNRLSFAGKSIGDWQQIRRLLRQTPAQVTALQRSLAANPLTAAFSDKTWAAVCQLCKPTSDIKALLPALSYTRLENYNRVAAEWLRSHRAKLPAEWHNELTQMVAWAEELRNIQLQKSDIQIFKPLLEAYIKSQRRWTGKIAWFFSSNKKAVRSWLARCQLPTTLEGANELLHLANCYENLHAAKERLQQRLPFLPYPETTDLDSWAKFSAQTTGYQRFLYGWRRLAERWLPNFDLLRTDWQALPEQLEQMLDTLGKITAWQGAWQTFLSSAQQERLWAHPQQAADMLRQMDDIFEDLCAIDALKEQFSEEERQIVCRLTAEAPNQWDEWVNIFDNSWRLSWLAWLENRFPVLRKASGQALLQTAAALREAAVKKQELSLPIAQSRAWERAFSNLAYNRLNNLVSYRDLLHQVSKKRGIWPLRKLIAAYWEELANLVPCWLVSPESASALFPMAEIFDLVIFDEASQCFAEKGIPAMYRGKQAVIVGDDKQLAPFDLYRPRWEEIYPEEEEVAPELEVESLLDLGKRYLPQVMLTAHYRSRYPELIHFSNRYFYQEKLQMLPHRSDWQPPQSPIQFVKVAGLWDNRTNRIEAEMVIQVIQEQLGRHLGKSIGVIAFNVHQQELIMDLLERSGLPLPESLFVKNIENVQGDERDCIIFSVGYAPSSSGKLQLHFGSLNMSKGENRLNVAVTRAREQIVVISSIYPQQLQVESTTNQGARLLKAYLEYAFAVSQQAHQPYRKWGISSQSASPHTLTHFLQTSDRRLRMGQPFADLIAVDEQEQPIEMIITDDSFHRAVSARSIFVYQPLHFTRKSWQYRYAFSRNWWKNN